MQSRTSAIDGFPVLAVSGFFSSVCALSAPMRSGGKSAQGEEIDDKPIIMPMPAAQKPQ